MSNVTTFLFDLDGLLVNSEDYWRLVGETFLRNHGRLFHDGFEKQIQGMGIRDGAHIWKEFYHLDITTEQVYQELHDLAEKIVYNNSGLHCMPGVQSFLNWTSNQPVRSAVVTSIWQSAALKTINRLNIGSYFEHIITLEDLHGSATKPSPEIYLIGAKLFNAQPNECVVFEDSINGSLAAQNAGMHCVVVNNKLPPTVFPRVDYLAQSFDDPRVIEICEQLITHV